MSELTDHTDERIARIHALFCELTRVDPKTLRLHMGRERTWQEYFHAGFTEDHLRLVVTWIEHERKRKRIEYSMRFSLLIQQLDKFEELLAEAQKWRPPKPETNKQKAVKQLRPVVNEEVTDNMRKAGDVLKPIFSEEFRKQINL